MISTTFSRSGPTRNSNKRSLSACSRLPLTVASFRYSEHVTLVIQRSPVRLDVAPPTLRGDQAASAALAVKIVSDAEETPGELPSVRPITSASW